MKSRLVFRFIRYILRMGWRALRYLIAFLIITFLLQSSVYRPGLAHRYRFDYVLWEIDALWSKASQNLWGFYPYMDDASHSQFVLNYMADLRRVHELEAQIEVIFINPTVDDPYIVTEDLRFKRDALRDNLSHRQAIAEGILERQVASVLIDEGFGFLGQLMPPISMHFTKMPQLMVTSPRDRIARRNEIAIDPLPLEEVIALEAQIAEQENVSTLVVPLGGMALFPAMIRETSNTAWAIETFAHEWVHHYFFFFPLGLNYFTVTDYSNREALIINETVADIFGKEIREKVIANYYPELVSNSPNNRDSEIVLTTLTPQDSFDYGSEMNETRVTVDNIMATIEYLYTHEAHFRSIGAESKADSYLDLVDVYVGKVERYMESRRILFYENGYRIRKMNQAYFAFYGGYQGGIPGIGGEDPIGPAVRDIRAMSANIHEFIVTMRGITTRDELLARLEELQSTTSVQTASGF